MTRMEKKTSLAPYRPRENLEDPPILKCIGTIAEESCCPDLEALPPPPPPLPPLLHLSARFQRRKTSQKTLQKRQGPPPYPPEEPPPSRI